MACVSALLVGIQPSAARSGPVIDGDKNSPQCRVALDMATQAFRSTSPWMEWPIPRPSDTNSRVVLARSADDISGGDALQTDPSVFDRIEPTKWGIRAVFWQRQAVGGQRMVVVDEPFGWQGDWYWLLFVPENITQTALLSRITQGDDLREALNALEPALGENRWTPPLVLEDGESSKLWIIDPGENSWGLEPWKVFVRSPEDLSAPCQIDLTPDGKPGLVRLPLAVQRFAALADEALGPGSNEGTLQPTARIRGIVHQDWANASERPWALTDTPYNSRAEVDANLTQWAKPVRKRATLLRRMNSAYNPAERALAAYYQRRFGVTDAVARRYSAYALDHMLRSYFVFHIDEPDRTAPTTPWPDHVR